MLQQFALVVGLQRALRRRQRRALWVVDQVQYQPAAFLPVAQGIELLQAGDAAVEHAIAALAVHVRGRVAGQRGRHFHSLLGEEGRQIVLARLGKDGEIAAVDHPHAHGAGCAHQIKKVRAQLWCAAGQVQGGNAARAQHLQNQGRVLGVHHLGAVGAGRDVAVQAALVALVAQVDLKCLQALAADRREVGGCEQGQGGVHLNLVMEIGSGRAAAAWTVIRPRAANGYRRRLSGRRTKLLQAPSAARRSRPGPTRRYCRCLR